MELRSPLCSHSELRKHQWTSAALQPGPTKKKKVLLLFKASRSESRGAKWAAPHWAYCSIAPICEYLCWTKPSLKQLSLPHTPQAPQVKPTQSAALSWRTATTSLPFFKHFLLLMRLFMTYLTWNQAVSRVFYKQMLLSGVSDRPHSVRHVSKN